MLDNIEGQKEQVVDARGPGRFAGSEAEPRQGVRSGHMPGSVNIPFTQVPFRADIRQTRASGTTIPAFWMDLFRKMRNKRLACLRTSYKIAVPFQMWQPIEHIQGSLLVSRTVLHFTINSWARHACIYRRWPV